MIWRHPSHLTHRPSVRTRFSSFACISLHARLNHAKFYSPFISELKMPRAPSLLRLSNARPFPSRLHASLAGNDDAEPPIRPPISVAGMVGMPFQYCKCPVNLLQEHHPGQFVSQGHLAEGEDQVGGAPGFVAKAIGRPHREQ